MAFRPAHWICSLLVLISAGPALAQAMDTAKQTQLTKVLISVFSLKYELDQDKNCAGKRFAALDLNQFIDAVPVHQLANGERDRAQMRAEFPGMLQKLYVQRMPDGRRTTLVAYETVFQQWLATPAGTTATPQDRCEKFNEMLVGGYQRLIEDIRQLGSK